MINTLQTAHPPAICAPLGTSDKMMGFVAASLIPALFWMIVLMAAGSALGIAVTGQTVVVTGASIATFLAAVFGALTHKAPH